MVKLMFALFLTIFLLLLQNWNDWWSNDPVGKMLFEIIMLSLCGALIYFIFIPIMRLTIQEQIDARSEDVPEWETE